MGGHDFYELCPGSRSKITVNKLLKLIQKMEKKYFFILLKPLY